MKILEDIHPLSEFKKNASKLIKQVQSTKRPMILTVNGRPAVVLQDPSAYARVEADSDYWATIAALREPLSQMDDPDAWIPIDEGFAQVRKKHLG
jgi:prevent-host-death family protein